MNGFYLVCAGLLLTVLGLLFAPMLRRATPGLRGICLLLVLAVGSGTILLYRALGAPEMITAVQNYAQTRQARAVALKELSQTLERTPQDPVLWARMGDLWLEEGRYPQAAQAYKQAVLRSRGEPHAILAYAHALMLAAGGQLIPEARTALEMVLRLDPENQEAKALLSGRTAFSPRHPGNAEGIIQDLSQ